MRTMRIPPELLYRLRNDVDIASVLERLGIPTGRRGGRLTFRCPDCAHSSAALIPYQNLGRCFHCQRNFNPIDLVMAERGFSFLEAVDYLERLLHLPPPGQL
jgi:DNA primase